MGNAVPHLCENCGKPDPLELPYCGFCGHPNGSGAAAPAVPPPVLQAPATAPPADDLELDPTIWQDIVPDAAVQAAAAPPPPPAPAPAPATPASSGRRGVLVGVVVAIVVLVVAAVLLAVSGSPKKPPASSSSGTSTTVARHSSSTTAPSAGGVVAGTAAAPWTSESYPASIDGGHLFTITCGSPTHCWAVGNDGTAADIIATTDGGATWTRQSYPSGTGLENGGHLFSISCGSPSTCQAVGSGTQLVILGTTDGGATWNVESYPPELAGGHLFTVYCISASTCWALGGAPSVTSVILGTTDGGATWTEQPYPSGLNLPDNGFLSITCPTPSQCFIIATSGGKLVLLHTANGGSSWAVQPVPSTISASSTGLGGITCPTTTYCAITGYSNGSSSNEAPLILVTRDGGKTLTAVPYSPALGLTSLTGVVCASATDCWTLGSSAGKAVILATTDAGAVWKEQPYPAGLNLGHNDLDSIYCASDSACYALGISTSGTQVILAAHH